VRTNIGIKLNIKLQSFKICRSQTAVYNSASYAYYNTSKVAHTDVLLAILSFLAYACTTIFAQTSNEHNSDTRIQSNTSGTH